jgi:hypothetical protein
VLGWAVVVAAGAGLLVASPGSALARLAAGGGPTSLRQAVEAATPAGQRHGSWRPAIAPLLAPTGMLAFFWYLHLRTGDALAYVHTQKRGWDQGVDFGVSNLRSALAIVTSRRVELYVLMIVACLVGIALALYVLARWRLPAPLLIYVVGIVGIALLSSNTDSVPRFLLAAFPLLIPIGRHLPDRAYPVVVACSAALMATLFWVTGLATLLSP